MTAAAERIEAETGDGAVLVVRTGAVRRLTLSYPERRNALSLGLREVLHDALADALGDPGVRVVVLDGDAGCFCSGGDISTMQTMDPMAARARVARIQRLPRLILGADKPVVAAVEGAASGAGLSLAACCDIVVTARDATWACAFTRLGLVPDMAALWVLPRRMGFGRARYAAMSAERFDGAAAGELGLAEIVVEPGAATARAMEVAATLAERAPAALAATKSLMARAPDSLDAFLRAEADAQALMFQTEDFVAGRDAFLAKRPPEWSGR